MRLWKRCPQCGEWYIAHDGGRGAPRIACDRCRRGETPKRPEHEALAPETKSATWQKHHRSWLKPVRKLKVADRRGFGFGSCPGSSLNPVVAGE